MWSTAVLKHLRTEAFRYSSTEAHVLNGYFRILPQSISYNKHLDIKKKKPKQNRANEFLREIMFAIYSHFLFGPFEQSSHFCIKAIFSCTI